jgi:hypothetical protein
VNGPEHYREAERRLRMAWEEDSTPERSAHLVAEAQVHATLALTAATAKTGACYGPEGETREQRAWDQAIRPTDHTITDEEI